MYQLIRYSSNNIEALGEYKDLKSVRKAIPKICPHLTSFRTRAVVIQDIADSLLDVGSYASVDYFIDNYKDEESIADFETFTYAVIMGKRMCLMTGDLETASLAEINAILAFAYGRTLYRGMARPTYRLIHLKLA